MAVLSSTDLTNLRSRVSAAKFYLSVLHPATLLTAKVNNGSIARGARSIAYDTGSGSGYPTITAGQTLEVVTATGTRKARIKTITGSAANGTITVGENDLPWADNQDFTILHNYEIWTIPPTIRNGIFYKDYEYNYYDQHLKPTPIVVMGSHRAKFLSGGSAIFNLNASASYAVAQGATISNFYWTCVKNGGGSSGITIANQASSTTTLTITEPGEYWLACMVTDSNGKAQTGRRVVWVHDPDNSPYTDFSIQSLEGSWGAGGWQATIEVFGDVTLDDFPDGSIACLWNENYFDPAISPDDDGNEEGYVNLWGVEDNILFAGYIRQDSSTDQPGKATGSVIFEITTIEALLSNVTDFGTVSLNAVASNKIPTAWYEYSSWLAVGRAIAAYLKEQTTLLDLVDIIGLATNTLGKKTVNFTEGSTIERCNALAYSRGIFAKLLSDRLGRLHLVTDIQMLNDTQRATLDTVFTIGAGDITDAVSIPRRPEDRVAVVTLDGFVWNGTTQTAVVSIAGGYREGSISYAMPGFRGVGSQAAQEQVVSDQTDANQKAGRFLAAVNNPIREIRSTFAGNYVGAFDIIPSLGWYEWGLPNDSLLRQLPLNGARLICRNVIVQINTATGAITVGVYFEPEAFGPDGITGNYPTNYPQAPAPPAPIWNPAYELAMIGSTDGGPFQKGFGVTPTPKTGGLSGGYLNIRMLHIDQTTGYTWICAPDGLAYSPDYGNNWVMINKEDLGEPTNTAGDSPAPTTDDLDQKDLCFDPSDSRRIYLLRTTATRAWLYTSPDYGQTWSNTQVII